MNKGIDNLLKLGNAIENTSLSEARELIGLIYPENFTFRGNDFQTARVNEIINCIYLVNKELAVKKKRDKRRFLSFVPSSDLDWIQTSNLLSRNQMRYSVAPRGLNAGANIRNNA